MRLSALLLLPLLLPAPAAAQAASSATLADCYAWARETSQELKSLRAAREESEQRARAALGGALPRLSWELTDTWQDPEGVETLEAAGFAGFVEKEQVDSRFVLTQPLFSGLREWHARAGFKRQAAADALRVSRAATRLHDRTAESYYAVLRAEARRDSAGSAARLASERVAELERFLKLGKARESEVHTARAHAAALRSQVRRLETAVAAARSDLSSLTDRDLAAVPLAPASGVPAVPAREEALARVGARADIRALRELEAAGRLAVRYEKGARWPTAELKGNYYTERPAFMKEIEWDLALSLKVPLYQGGSVEARRREAEAAHARAALALEQGEREARREVQRAHAELAGAVAELESLEEAAAAAQKSYGALREEYELGLTTNLEVLQALDLLQEQQSARDAGRIEVRRLAVALDAAAGDVP